MAALARQSCTWTYLVLISRLVGIHFQNRSKRNFLALAVGRSVVRSVGSLIGERADEERTSRWQSPEGSSPSSRVGSSARICVKAGEADCRRLGCHWRRRRLRRRRRDEFCSRREHLLLCPIGAGSLAGDGESFEQIRGRLPSQLRDSGPRPSLAGPPPDRLGDGPFGPA